MLGTILIADHDTANLAFLSEKLLSQGFNVITASDGPGALEQFASHDPDVVLLDVWLPGLNGIEVCRRMKSDTKHRLTPVALMDGLSFESAADRCFAAGADEVFPKPISHPESVAKLQALLRSKSYMDGQAESVLMALGRTIESRDPYTEGHCERLADYATRLGIELGLPQDQIEALEVAGVLHDIGKVCLPDAILLKQGPLDAQELQIMRAHPVVGEKICAPLRCFRLILPIIRHHHERMDGSGYPDGLTGNHIPLTARILQTVDIYDALTTNRPYRNGLEPREAIAVLQEEAALGWRDPNLVATFERLVC